ncbi:MAG: hypothetical protein F9K24_20370 [Leptonema illini]|jgi:uncharacterized Zn-binding protein involved in type VI secretion|uniref:PAAR repeat-containing protein n=1 Tax=Leptonema illini TaxID=183 RepID=A0A833GXX0_9LEPT|nr:MAG: hypothetical protein F9K24_20370 [Leptonema illini]
MGEAAAKEGDYIKATDTHIETVGPVPSPIPHNFDGTIDGELSKDVKIEGKAAATVDSTATNSPAHTPKVGSFSNPPKNKGTIKQGSSTVKINGKAAARNGDMAETCNDPADLPVGTVDATGTVKIGG